jgi:ATP-dependent DNA helicase RecG
MVSLLPPESLDRLRAMFGTAFRGLSPVEVQTLVAADLEEVVSNARMQQLCDDHPADLTRMFRGLVDRGFLIQGGQKRTYRLPPSHPQTGPGPPQTGPGPPQTGAGPPQTTSGRQVGETEAVPPENDPVLLAIAREAKDRPWLPSSRTREIIKELCRGRYLTATQVGALMGRDPEKVRERHLSDMVRTGELEPLRQDARPGQAYRTREQNHPPAGT